MRSLGPVYAQISQAGIAIRRELLFWSIALIVVRFRAEPRSAELT